MKPAGHGGQKDLIRAARTATHCPGADTACAPTGWLLCAAKNVILAGVKAVVLHDPSPVELRDLSSQFYLSPDDVGAPTSDACQARLQELNVAVAVTSKSSEISMDELSQFQVLCLAPACPALRGSQLQVR